MEKDLRIHVFQLPHFTKNSETQGDKVTCIRSYSLIARLILLTVQWAFTKLHCYPLPENCGRDPHQPDLNPGISTRTSQSSNHGGEEEGFCV